MTAKLVVVASAGAAAALATFAIREADPKALVRWGTRYGLSGAVNRIAARGGDPVGRLSHDPQVRSDPYPYYTQLRDAGAVVPGRVAAATARHRTVAEILRSPVFRSGFPDQTVPAPIRAAAGWARDPALLTFLDPPSLLVINGADHARLRRHTSKAFTPRAIAALAARIEDIATELLDTLPAAQDAEPNQIVDIINAYAQILPVLVIADILGVPAALRTTFTEWTTRIVPLTEIGIGYPAYRQAEAAVRELNTWLRDHFTRLRRHPGPDLLSRMIHSVDPGDDRADDRAGGDQLTDEELMVTAGLLLLGGFETTVNLIGNGTVLLLHHRDQLTHLAAHPEVWPNAVEEILRYDPPSRHTVRYPAQDTLLGGVPLARGRLILLLLAAANRDPDVFTNPDHFDVTRANAREHLSFARGPHHCPGAALARLEGQIALRRLFERFPAITLSGQPTRRPTLVACGYSRIPVTLHTPT
jgi:cytochrome P450